MMNYTTFTIHQIPPDYYFIEESAYIQSDYKGFEKFQTKGLDEVVSSKGRVLKRSYFEGKNLVIVTENYVPLMTIKDTCYKGTRILLGNDKDDIVTGINNRLRHSGFIKIELPIVNYSKYFDNKVGDENNNLMFNFKDRADRDLCLAPEYTAIIQELSKTTFKDDKDLKVWYLAECFRGEKPQKGRYRQFTQLGVEIINPTKEYDLCNLAKELVSLQITPDRLIVDNDIKRGLDYYNEGKGFEISLMDGDRRVQLVGGGEYDGGVGFAIGIDRLIDYRYTPTKYVR